MNKRLIILSLISIFSITSLIAKQNNIIKFISQYDVCYQECAGEDGCIMETEACVQECKEERDNSILLNNRNTYMQQCLKNFDKCSDTVQTSCSLDASKHNRVLYECKKNRDVCFQNIVK